MALNGIKIFGDFSGGEGGGRHAPPSSGDAAAGLDKVFHDLLRTQGAIYRRLLRLQRATRRRPVRRHPGEQMLVGSASFMHLMEVPLPQGLNVQKRGVLRHRRGAGRASSPSTTCSTARMQPAAAQPSSRNRVVAGAVPPGTST
ncbi:MAG: hypothetical protein ACLRWQ_10415 [Flavonifractor plautii]